MINFTILHTSSLIGMSDQHSQALSIPPCPFRDRFKKALRLIRNRDFYSSPCARKHSTITDTPRKGVSVTTSEDVVVAADTDGYLYSKCRYYRGEWNPTLRIAVQSTASTTSSLSFHRCQIEQHHILTCPLNMNQVCGLQLTESSIPLHFVARKEKRAKVRCGAA